MSFRLPSDEVTPSDSSPISSQPLLLLPPEGYQPSTPELQVDALPYIDAEYNDPHLKSLVHQLITAEMQSSPRPLSSYLSSLSSLPSLASLPSFQPNYQSPAVTLSPLSTSHLSSFPSPPPSLASSSPPYSSTPSMTSPASLSLAVSHLLHSDVALQLIRQYGSEQCGLVGRHLRTRRDELKVEVEEVGRKVEEVNRERKRRQAEVEEKLKWSEAEWWRLLNNCRGIQHSITQMQSVTPSPKRPKAVQ